MNLGKVVLEPAAGFTGLAQFRYHVTDADAHSTTGMVAVLVVAPEPETSALDIEAIDHTIAIGVDLQGICTEVILLGIG